MVFKAIILTGKWSCCFVREWN